MNPDPYVECDPEVDIDKAQAEEDANYFDEEDLGNLTSIQNSWNIFILRVLELFDFSAEQHFGTEARGRFFHRGNDFSQRKWSTNWRGRKRGEGKSTSSQENGEFDKDDDRKHNDKDNAEIYMMIRIMMKNIRNWWWSVE